MADLEGKLRQLAEQSKLADSDLSVSDIIREAAALGYADGWKSLQRELEIAEKVATIRALKDNSDAK